VLGIKENACQTSSLAGALATHAIEPASRASRTAALVVESAAVAGAMAKSLYPWASLVGGMAQHPIDLTPVRRSCSPGPSRSPSTETRSSGS
jgi:hypothetical protein